MFWKKKDDEIKELRKEIREIDTNYATLYRAINRISGEITAVIDTLVRKKIIEVSKKELKRCATRDEIENRLTVIETKLRL